MEILVDIKDSKGTIASLRKLSSKAFGEPNFELKVTQIESKCYFHKFPRIVLSVKIKGERDDLIPYICTFAVAVIKEDETFFVGTREMLSESKTLIVEGNSLRDVTTWAQHYMRQVEKDRIDPTYC